MTGGHPDALAVNRGLARRRPQARGHRHGPRQPAAALRDPRLADTYTIARETAPDAMLFANVGISQLLDQEREPALDADGLRELVDHDPRRCPGRAPQLPRGIRPARGPDPGRRRPRGAGRRGPRGRRPGHPQGDRGRASGAPSRMRALARRRRGASTSAASAGPRSPPSRRTAPATAGDRAKARLGQTFGSWGIPTPVCVAGCAGILPVIATGGVRTGLDAAKAIALGATAVGIGRPMLQAVLAGRGRRRRLDRCLRPGAPDGRLPDRRPPSRRPADRPARRGRRRLSAWIAQARRLTATHRTTPLHRRRLHAMLDLRRLHRGGRGRAARPRRPHRQAGRPGRLRGDGHPPAARGRRAQPDGASSTGRKNLFGEVASSRWSPTSTPSASAAPGAGPARRRSRSSRSASSTAAASRQRIAADGHPARPRRR